MKIRRLVSSFIPKSVKHKIIFFLKNKRVKNLRNRFNQIESSTRRLDLKKLYELNSKHKFPSEYGYSNDAVYQRGKERSHQILGFNKKAKNILELGCWDGMLSPAR